MNRSMVTIEDIKKTLDDYDKICRPLIVFLNPEDAELLREAFPNIEKEVVFRETISVERGKCYCVERKIFDDYFKVGE